MPEAQKKQAVFNGHTWIVVIVAIVVLFLLGITALVGLFYLMVYTNESDTMRVIQGAGIPTIPYVVVKGIINIVDRLTYLPKEV